MHNLKKVFWNELNQRIRYTQSMTFEGSINFQYVGMMTEAEFDLLLETLFCLFEDDPISIDDFCRTFGDIRTFCDQLKRITDTTND